MSECKEVSSLGQSMASDRGRARPLLARPAPFVQAGARACVEGNADSPQKRGAAATVESECQVTGLESSVERRFGKDIHE